MAMEISEVKYLLNNHHKHCSRSEINFILSHIDTMACFCNTQTTYHSIIAVTDLEYNPIFIHETNAYAHICGISDNGNYAIFRTANSSSEDGNKAFFVDVYNRSILWKKALETSFKSITSFYINTNNQTITEIHKDYNAIFSFDGEFLNKDKWLSERYKHEDCNSYELIGIASNILTTLKSSGYEKDKLKLAIKYIKATEADPAMSTYQLSLTYRQLGDCYLAFSDNNNALSSYEKALELNPNLPIKRIIRKLENT